MPECTLSPTTLRGKNRPAHQEPIQGLHELLPAFLALDLVQDSLRGRLADGMAGIMRMISVIRRPFRSAISVQLLSGYCGGRPAR